MIRTVLLGAVLGAGPQLVAKALRKRLPRRPQGYPTAGFRAGPRWSWCPAERAQTPHLTDVGGLRCLSCKTRSAHEVKPRG